MCFGIMVRLRIRLDYLPACGAVLESNGVSYRPIYGIVYPEKNGHIRHTITPNLTSD